MRQETPMIRLVHEHSLLLVLCLSGTWSVACASRNNGSGGAYGSPDGSMSGPDARADGGKISARDGGPDTQRYAWPDAGCPEPGVPASTFPGLSTSTGWSALPTTTCLFTSPPDPTTKADNQCPPNGFGGSKYAFHDYCGGMFANDTGGFADTYRSYMYLFGGGHNNYAGNELYRLDLTQPSKGLALLRVTDPTVPTSADSPYYDSESGCIGALPPDETITKYEILSIKRNGAGTATAVLDRSTVFVPNNRGIFGKAYVQVEGVTPSTLNVLIDVDSVGKTNVPNDTITWSSAGAAVTGSGGTASTTWSACTGPGCKPNARHTPGSTSLYVPPPVDRLFTAGGDSACGAGDPDPDAWTAPLACLSDDTPWTRIAETNPSYDPPLSSGGVAFGAHGLGWFFINAYDSNTGLVWTSDLWSLYTYDFATNLFSLKSKPGNFTLSLNLQGAIDPVNKVLVAAGGCRNFPITSIQRTSGTVSLTYDISQPSFTELGPRTDEFLVGNTIFVSGVANPAYGNVGMPLFSVATAVTSGAAATATITYPDVRADAAASSGGLAYSCSPNDSGSGGVGGFYIADISDPSATTIAQQDWTVASITDATPLRDPITGTTTPSGITCANFLSGGGANHLYPSSASQCPGLSYDTKRQNLVGWPNQGSAIYVLVSHPEMSPPRVQCYTEDYGGSLPVNSLSETGVPDMSNGTHGRFQYFPGPDVFLLLNSFKLPAYVLHRR
jgi:hypothetical protein